MQSRVLLSRLDFALTHSQCPQQQDTPLHGDCVSCVRKAISEKEEGALGFVLANDGLLGRYFTIQADKRCDR